MRWPCADLLAVVDGRVLEAPAEAGLPPRAQRARDGRRDARVLGQARLRGLADRLHAHRADHGLLVAHGVGVQLLVQVVEGLDRARELGLAHAAVRARHGGHRHVEGLARIAEVHEAMEDEVAAREPRRAQLALGVILHLGEQLVDAARLRATRGRDVAALRIDDVVGEQQAQRREGRRGLRHQQLADAELVGLHAGVHGAVAAIHHHAEVARVEARFRGDAPDRVRHVRVHDAEDAVGRLDDVEAERLADLLEDRLAHALRSRA